MTPVTDKEFLVLLARQMKAEEKEFTRLSRSYLEDVDENVSESYLILTRREEVGRAFAIRAAKATQIYGRICHQLAQHGVAWESEGPTLDDRY